MLQQDILQHWGSHPDKLTEPLPAEIATFFNWSPSSSLNSVRWALLQSAPNSGLLIELGPQSVLPNGDMWALLAAAAQHHEQSYNLSILLTEDKYLVQDGRYHSHRTVPIFHQLD